MRELSLHIIDIVENSIQADATLIKITIKEDDNNDLLLIKIIDNGRGISKEKINDVRDPFKTSRKTRRVGLGLSLLEAATSRCEGQLTIKSREKICTSITATFKYSHIDRAPIGNMADSIMSIIMSLKDESHIAYKHYYNSKKFCIDTREIKKILGEEISLNQLEVVNWIREYVKEGLLNIMEV